MVYASATEHKAEEHCGPKAVLKRYVTACVRAKYYRRHCIAQGLLNSVVKYRSGFERTDLKKNQISRLLLKAVSTYPGEGVSAIYDP